MQFSLGEAADRNLMDASSVDGVGVLFLAVFRAIIIIVSIALISVFAPEYSGLALLIVGVLAFVILALALGLSSEKTITYS